MQPPKNHIYLTVEEYLGIDMPGVIAVPITEAVLWAQKKEKDNAKIGK